MRGDTLSLVRMVKTQARLIWVSTVKFFLWLRMAGSLFRLSMLRLYRITVNYGNSSLGPLRVQFHIEFCWRSDGLNWDGTLLHCREMGYI